jgi:hypothetical protein
LRGIVGLDVTEKHRPGESHFRRVNDRAPFRRKVLHVPPAHAAKPPFVRWIAVPPARANYQTLTQLRQSLALREMHRID